jgi:hypothetical protein
MTCRQFHRHWSARPTGELPPAMQQHLAACPACAAMAHADAATDASLRQLAAVPPPADVDLARAAIIQKLQTETDRPPLECGSLLPLFSLSRLKTRAGGTRTPSLQSGEPFPSHYSGESGVKPPHSKEAGLPRAPWLTGNQRLVWAAAGLTTKGTALVRLPRTPGRRLDCRSESRGRRSWRTVALPGRTRTCSQQCRSWSPVPCHGSLPPHRNVRRQTARAGSSLTRRA